MTNYNWNYPTTLWVGENRVNDLSAACKNLNIKNQEIRIKTAEKLVKNLNKISFSQDNIYFFDKNGNRLRKTT